MIRKKSASFSMFIGRGDGPALAAPEPLPAWHAESSDAVLRRLKASRQGLTQNEVEARRAQAGWNEIPEAKRPVLALVFLRQFRSPLIYILLAAMTISLAFGHFGDGWFIGAVLVLNAIIGTTQEWQAESSALALRKLMAPFTVVRREGERQRLAARELVPGDAILLTGGDAVPADARLIQSSRLQVDESLLTGESASVYKQADLLLPAETSLAERRNLVHAGTLVVEGQAQAVVCRIGLETEVGRIARSLIGRSTPPPLLVQLEHFTRQIGLAVAAAAILLGAVQVWRGAPLLDIFFLAVALAVSAIPEGLPIAVTVVLARASRRIARRNVIVRLLPAVEGLGACTLIASDKTGTLTANRLTLQRLWIPTDGGFEVTEDEVRPAGSPETEPVSVAACDRARLRALARSGALCSEASLEESREAGAPPRALGDPVDVAFLVLARMLGLPQAALEQAHQMIQFLPFSAQHRSSASFHARGHLVLAHVKGAPEAVFPMCTGGDLAAAEQAAEELARAGYRVLAVAAGQVSEDEARAAEPAALRNLHLLWLANLIDPVRPEVPARDPPPGRGGGLHGHRDHPATALAIARQLGIASAVESVVTGRQLAEIQNDPERLRRARVFRRVEPTKARDRTFTTAGRRVVAVTGDGVNDAPALRQAFLGGGHGTLRHRGGPPGRRPHPHRRQLRFTGGRH